MDSRRIDKGDFPHADNAHQRTIGHTTHQFVELGGYPEEERAFYLVNFHAFGYFQDFVGSRFGSGRNIELVVEYRYLRGLCHAAQEEDNGQQQPDFDGDRKIEYNGQQEGDDKYRHVRFRIFQQGTYRAPTAHVIGNDDQYTGEARHGHELDKRHKEQEYQQKDDSVYYTGNGSAPAVVDIGHGTGNGSGDRDSPEERNHDIGGSLCDKLGIGVGLVAGYTVGDGGR